MKVAIDISPLKSGHQYRGIGVYTKNLYQALKNLDDGNEYIMTTKSVQADADVVHYPFFDFFFMTLPLIKHAPTIVTIHDTIPLIYPNEYKPGLKGRLKLRSQRQSLRGVARVITDSNQSAEDVVKYLGVPSSKVETVYLAADNKFVKPSKSTIVNTLKKLEIKAPYLLYVGDINFNKNIPSLLNVFSKIKSEHTLVLVSRAMANDIPESQYLWNQIKQLKLSKRVKVLSDIPSEPLDDLLGVFAGADWYIQPSLYEGFGLPVLEAWSVGVPVISSIGGSLNELVDTAAITFDPIDDESMVDTIRETLGLSAKEKDGWIEKGKKRLKYFSWEETAKETVKIYNDVVNSNS